MNYHLLTKKLNLPTDFSPPTKLNYEDVVAVAIARSDLADDVRGINASLDLIHRTRGGGWPTGSVTADFNFVDLVWHELEFREGHSFTYVLRNVTGGYLGCCYLYPMGGRTELTEDLLHYDVDVSWWVTPDAYKVGYYTKSFRALCYWLETEFPFWTAYFSNREIPEE
jgi:hypothetical protein